ncbi:DsrE family protein [Maridesulfovibrio sp.]|uniref:DsrE family protein n=1 Tax=Maridesulfovibrio sp. TaxID=2795000 RepID=UPI002A18B8D3|nr:DsrE family protein [Maridesulfovibrio sp.]
MSYKVVFHVDWDDGLALKMGLTNMENLLKNPGTEDSEVHMVVNGQAVRLFRKELAEENVSIMKDLNARGVRFCICNNSLTKFNYAEKDMLDLCEIVPAGIAELCKLQASGCAYVKP